MFEAGRKLVQQFPLWERVRRSPRLRRAFGFEDTLWTRKASEDESRRRFQALGPASLRTLEISGRTWETFGFGAYRSVAYPEFDLCRDELPERFDLVIAEHVFEHLPYPYRAGRNALAMLAPGGMLWLVTPFLYKVHPCPGDFTRWTETGLKHLLVECGFATDEVETGSWGNRACVQATFHREYRLFNRRLHPMVDEKEYPIVVWAAAKAPKEARG